MQAKIVVVTVVAFIFGLVHVFPPMSLDQVECYDDLSHNIALPILVYFEQN